MRKFDLVSVDWDSVRLMQAGQFKQETFYLEELVRWTLQRGRIAGLLHLADDGVSRPSPEGDRVYSVVVRGCLAVGRQGQIIEIPWVLAAPIMTASWAASGASWPRSAPRSWPCLRPA